MLVVLVVSFTLGVPVIVVIMVALVVCLVFLVESYVPNPETPRTILTRPFRGGFAYHPKVI